VIIDKDKQVVSIYELTVPLTVNIENRNAQKSQKYAPFITDMTGYKCTVNCFEVSSTGFISTRNKITLTALHKFMRKDLKKSDFLSNLNSLVWYSSYSLWLSRETQEYPLPHTSSPTSTSPTPGTPGRRRRRPPGGVTGLAAVPDSLGLP
jgi:hypothetical protein